MAETLQWMVIFGALAVLIAALVLFVFEWLERREYLARAREDAAFDREMERQGKTRHCDGWSVWWE